MTDRLRLFVGAIELTYGQALIRKSNDQVVDSGSASIVGTSSVTSSSVIDFKKDDGSTTVFSAQVQHIGTPALWALKLLSNGYELHNFRVEQVYTNQTPEAIVQDIIDNQSTTLTYASTAVSGVTIEKYIAKGYAIDVIKDMMEVLQWQIKIDSSDNFFFEPGGTTSNGVVFTNGTNSQILSWDTDKTDMMNHVKVVGGFQSFSTNETVTGTGTVYLLTQKPNLSLKATESGTEIPESNYTVDADEKTVTFATAKTNPVFDYSYNKPIIVEDQDDDSIALNRRVFKEVEAPFLNTFADARRYAANLLSVFSVVAAKVRLVIPRFNFDIDVAEAVSVIDNVKSRTGDFIISEIKYKAESGTTEVELGNRNTQFFDWQRQVQDRIKDLERKFVTSGDETFARSIRADLNVSLVSTKVFEYNNPQDSWCWTHDTLGRFRSSIDFEPDCSNNLNNGTWTGSNIGGSQFLTGAPVLHLPLNSDSRDLSKNNNDGTDTAITYVTGKLDNAASFNATTSKITISDAVPIQDIWDGGGSFAFWINPNSDGEGSTAQIFHKALGVWGLFNRDESGGNLRLKFTKTFSGDNGSWQTGVVVPINTLTHVVLTYNADSASNNPQFYLNGVAVTTTEVDTPTGTRTTDVGGDLVIGNKAAQTHTFDGELDDVRLFDFTLDTGDIAFLYNSGTGTEWHLLGPRLGYGEWNATDTVLTISDAATIQNVWDGGGGMAFHFKPRSDGEGSAGRIIQKGSAWSILVQEEAGGLMRLRFSYDFSGSDGDWRTGVVVPINDWIHGAITYDADSTANVPVFWLDGVSVALTTSTQPTGTRATDVGSDLIVGNLAAASATFDGFLDEVMGFDATIATARVTDIIAKNISTTDQVFWMSMDNTTWGDRFSQRQKVI